MFKVCCSPILPPMLPGSAAMMASHSTPLSSLALLVVLATTAQAVQARHIAPQNCHQPL